MSENIDLSKGRSRGGSQSDSSRNTWTKCQDGEVARHWYGCRCTLLPSPEPKEKRAKDAKDWSACPTLTLSFFELLSHQRVTVFQQGERTVLRRVIAGGAVGQLTLTSLSAVRTSHAREASLASPSLQWLLPSNRYIVMLIPPTSPLSFFLIMLWTVELQPASASEKELLINLFLAPSQIKSNWVFLSCFKFITVLNIPSWVTMIYCRPFP